MNNYRTHDWMVEASPHGLDEVAQENISKSLRDSTLEQLLEIKWAIEQEGVDTHERFEKWGGFGQPGFYTAARNMIDSEIERRIAAGELTQEAYDEMKEAGFSAIAKKKFDKFWERVKKEKLI